MSESRREGILAATATVIAERGLCDTRIADIARIVGVSPALILYYFPNKSALLSETVIYFERRFHEAVTARLADLESAEEKLYVLIEESCPDPDRTGDQTDSWLLWPATWEMARLDPALAEARATLDAGLRAHIVTIVEEGVAKGEFADVDAEEFAIQLAALLDGLAIETLLGDPAVDADRMNRLAQGFVRGMLTQKVRG